MANTLCQAKTKQSRHSQCKDLYKNSPQLPELTQEKKKRIVLFHKRNYPEKNMGSKTEINLVADQSIA